MMMIIRDLKELKLMMRMMTRLKRSCQKQVIGRKWCLRLSCLRMI